MSAFRRLSDDAKYTHARIRLWCAGSCFPPKLCGQVDPYSFPTSSCCSCYIVADTAKVPASADETLCLDVLNGSTDDGAVLTLTPCVPDDAPEGSGGEFQKWSFSEVM